MKKTTIIGAGMIGLCSAYYLQKSGHQVTIVEAGDANDNCSFGNAGFFSPSHMIPLASPGIIAQGLKWMTNPESPFYIKPAVDMDLIKWCWQFYRASNKKTVKKAIPTLNQMLMDSRRMIEEILTDTKIDAGFGSKGMLMYCQSQKVMDEEAELAEVARDCGQDVDVLSAEQAAALNPGLDLNVSGAVHFKNDAWMTPHSFMISFRDYLVDQGVYFQLNTKVTDLEQQNGKITALVTDQGVLKADLFVLATGSWSAKLLKKVGVNILLQGGKGYSFIVPNPPVMPQTAGILTEARVAVTPMKDGLRFAGTMEVNGLDLSVNPRRVNGIHKSIASYFPQFEPKDLKGHEVWAGLRPCSPDGMPYIGKTNKFENLIVATGHAMLGISMGPATGQLVSAIANDQPTGMDMELLKVDRFG